MNPEDAYVEDEVGLTFGVDDGVIRRPDQHPPAVFVRVLGGTWSDDKHITGLVQHQICERRESGSVPRAAAGGRQGRKDGGRTAGSRGPQNTFLENIVRRSNGRIRFCP
ncbi:hypothetical protein INR49_018353, partial [Caranx melampygus]